MATTHRFDTAESATVKGTPAGRLFRIEIPRASFFKVAVAVAMYMACNAAKGDDHVELRVRYDAAEKPALVATGLVAGWLAGASVSGGILAYTSSSTTQDARGWRPVLATGVGLGVVIGLVIGFIEANRSLGEAPRPTRDGLAFQEQHPDRSRVVVAGLPALRF